MDRNRFRNLEINGGTVRWAAQLRLELRPTKRGYADAQIDDYGMPATGGSRLQRRSKYPWHTGTKMSLRARFSHGSDALRGTAGFGFWNAPFGDPSVRGPALPQACWFFFASEPSDLPVNPNGAGRGWFAATLDVSPARALGLMPLAPFILLLNHAKGFRRRVWPAVLRHLNTDFAHVGHDMRQWHLYQLRWNATGCAFTVDGETLLQAAFSPRGPLGFVCWIDNQYLAVTNRGRVRWGVLPISQSQWLEVSDLWIEKAHE